MYPGAVAVMFADPRPTPVTCACVVGVVAPAGTTTLEVTVTREESAVSVTVTPPAGAGVDSVTGNGAVSPRPTFSPVGIVIVPGFPTVTLAVASKMLGPLACITVEPRATPVTGTFAVVAPAANATVAGTVATATLSELRLTVRPPAGAGAGKVNVRFCVVVPVIVRVFGVNAGVAFTCTVWLAGVYAGAVAVMFADPRPTPVTWGCVVGVVAPAGTVTLEVTVTLEGSLLVKVTVTPPAGAGVERVTANGTDCPAPTVTLEANVIEPGLATVTFAVASAMPERWRESLSNLTPHR